MNVYKIHPTHIMIKKHDLFIIDTCPEKPDRLNKIGYYLSNIASINLISSIPAIKKY